MSADDNKGDLNVPAVQIHRFLKRVVRSVVSAAQTYGDLRDVVRDIRNHVETKAGATHPALQKIRQEQKDRARVVVDILERVLDQPELHTLDDLADSNPISDLTHPDVQGLDEDDDVDEIQPLDSDEQLNKRRRTQVTLARPEFSDQVTGPITDDIMNRVYDHILTDIRGGVLYRQLRELMRPSFREHGGFGGTHDRAAATALAIESVLRKALPADNLSRRQKAVVDLLHEVLVDESVDTPTEASLAQIRRSNLEAGHVSDVGFRFGGPPTTSGNTSLAAEYKQHPRPFKRRRPVPVPEGEDDETEDEEETKAINDEVAVIETQYTPLVENLEGTGLYDTIRRFIRDRVKEAQKHKQDFYKDEL